jgi:hypothetical protein
VALFKFNQEVTMNKHTPGPWRYDGHGINADGIRLVSFEDEAYPTFDEEGCYARSEKQDADGAIMAASLDMYETLNQFIEEFERGREWISYDTLDRAVRALRKAEGKA